MVDEIERDVVIGDGSLEALAPELDSAEPDAARVITRGLRRAPQNLQLVLGVSNHAPTAARRAIAHLARDAGASEPELDAVKTVVSEAVTNVVRHAYDDFGGVVHVDAAVIDGELTVLVVDEGHGPRVPSADPGLGLGWKLLAQMTDHFAVIQRAEGGTMVYMRLTLSGARA